MNSEIKNATELTLNLSSNMVGDPNDETNFSHKLLLINTQNSKNCKVFANGSSTNMKYSKTQLSYIVQVGGLLGRILGRLLKTGLIKTASATDAAIQKKFFRLSTAILIILTKEVDFIMKIVKSLKDFALLIKVVGKKTKNEPKEQKGGLLARL